MDLVDFIHTPPFKDASFLRQKYVVEMLSCKEIARQIFSARTTVLKYLKLFDIPLRPSGTNLMKVSQLSYGRRMVGRAEVDHLKEQDGIKKIKSLRQQGFSYWKIAAALNTLKVPTKTRRGRWHARSVMAILDNQPV